MKLRKRPSWIHTHVHFPVSACVWGFIALTSHPTAWHLETFSHFCFYFLSSSGMSQTDRELSVWLIHCSSARPPPQQKSTQTWEKSCWCAGRTSMELLQDYTVFHLWLVIVLNLPYHRNQSIQLIFGKDKGTLFVLLVVPHRNMYNSYSQKPKQLKSEIQTPRTIDFFFFLN